MHNFQSFIKNIRESKELKRDTIADAINLSEDTIQIIEEANNDSLLQSSGSLLKNQIRRYCEYLEIPEKKIVSILNKVDILYYKKSRYGKLKTFDYINRLAIVVIIIAIVVLAVKQVKEKMDVANSDPKISQSSIIYTPIQYDRNSYGKQQTAKTTTDTTTTKVNSQKNIATVTTSSPKIIASGSSATSTKINKSATASPKDDETTNTASSTDTTNTISHHRATSVAHPPATANMSNMIIGAPSSSASSLKIPTKQ
ncbi:helix-turn-helix domain-containing protein [Francisella sp. 19X1-34]|uniref:helix-turn-helix domain-containing protein n=1 Tax=Francisella sp. 19X1-34 TaxID=3087177 RepID=UPI002E301A50|nr:helix-turn-helix domain-containing protein [Francisella sp. 19X1-34]MED7789197.1 helix-turn-helix domain-containing protein [Francisella sp. 19X1-34]